MLAWVGVDGRVPLRGFRVQLDRGDALDELRRLVGGERRDFPGHQTRDQQIAWLRRNGYRVRGLQVAR